MMDNIIPAGAAALVTVATDIDLGKVEYAKITFQARQKRSRFADYETVSVVKETPAVVIDGNNLCVLLSEAETAYLNSIDPKSDAALYVQALLRDIHGQEMTSRIMEGRVMRRLQ